jgi:uncharacterized protein YdeI (YjbR/CyaY-like superfamily)
MTRARGPVAFASAEEFRAWLARHHASATELDVLLWKTHAKHRGMGYTEALDEALCFGWIDGVRRSVDADSYRIRFTPRKQGSRWSLVNVRHVERLEKAGRMHAAGRAAFQARDPDDPRRYSFETEPVVLSPAFARKFRGNRRAWRYFESTPPWYRRVATFWVMSAKRPETRERRLAHLIERSEQEIPIRELDRSKSKAAAPAKPAEAARAKTTRRTMNPGRRSRS